MVLLDLNVGIFYLFVKSFLSVYGIIMASRSNNFKYVFLGALQCATQMVSYEISIGFIIIIVPICVGSCNFNEIIIAQKQIWFGIVLFIEFIMFFISYLAKINRVLFIYQKKKLKF
jgi:NADH-quinone oxidoreductase subunit H